MRSGAEDQLTKKLNWGRWEKARGIALPEDKNNNRTGNGQRLDAHY